MGFLNDATSGYQKHKNTKQYTNEDFYRLLSEIEMSFGTPVMDSVGKKEAVVYHGVGKFDVYVKADKKSVEVARVLGKQENIGKNLAKELAIGMVSNAASKDMSVADRAVDELSDVVKRLLDGEVITKSNVTKTVGESLKYYMKQKVLSIRDKYSIYDAYENPVYNVVGKLTGLSFSVQNADGDELLSIKKKLVAVMPEYTLMEGKKEVGHIKKKMKLTRAEIAGKVNGKELTIKGDMMGYAFNIMMDGVAVGNVDTERLTWGDCYSIEVLDPELKDLIVAIAIICDNTLKNK